MVILWLYGLLLAAVSAAYVGEPIPISVTGGVSQDVAIAFKNPAISTVSQHMGLSIAATAPVAIVATVRDANNNVIYQETLNGTTMYSYNLYLVITNKYTLTLVANATCDLNVLIEPLHQEYIGPIKVDSDVSTVYLQEFLTLESAEVILSDIAPGVTMHCEICNIYPANTVLKNKFCKSFVKVVSNNQTVMFFFHPQDVLPFAEKINSNLWFFTFRFDLSSSSPDYKNGNDATATATANVAAQLNDQSMGIISFLSVRKLDFDTVTNVTYPIQVGNVFVSIAAFDSVAVTYFQGNLVDPTIMLAISLPSEFIMTHICISPLSPFSGCNPVSANSEVVTYSAQLSDFRPNDLYYLVIVCRPAQAKHETTAGITSIKLALVTELETSIGGVKPAIYKALWYKNTIYDKMISPSRQIHMKFVVPDVRDRKGNSKSANVYIDYHPVEDGDRDPDNLCHYSTRIMSPDMETIYYYDFLHTQHIYQAKSGAYYLIMQPQLGCLGSDTVNILEATVYIELPDILSTAENVLVLRQGNIVAGSISPVIQDGNSGAVTGRTSTNVLLFYNRKYEDDNGVCIELISGNHPVRILVEETSRSLSFNVNTTSYTQTLINNRTCFRVTNSSDGTLSSSVITTVLSISIATPPAVAVTTAQTGQADQTVTEYGPISFCAYPLPRILDEYLLIPPNKALSVRFSDKSSISIGFRPISSLAFNVTITYNVYIIPQPSSTETLISATLCGVLQIIESAPSPEWKKPMLTITRTAEDTAYITDIILLSQLPELPGKDNLLRQVYYVFILAEDTFLNSQILYASSTTHYIKTRISRVSTVQVILATFGIVFSLVGIAITAIFCARMMNKQYTKRRIKLV